MCKDKHCLTGCSDMLLCLFLTDCKEDLDMDELDVQRTVRRVSDMVREGCGRQMEVEGFGDRGTKGNSASQKEDICRTPSSA